MNGKQYMERVASIPCVLCSHLGEKQGSRTYVHHVREGKGASQRASDYLAVALCWGCHQGPHGVHGDRAFMKIAKLSELDLLAKTIAALAAEGAIG